MGFQHRAQIFELRSQVNPATGRLYSVRKIAELLGVSPGVVEKELYRKASDPPESGQGAAPGATAAPPPLGADLDGLGEARRRVQLEQLAAQELDVKARRLEAEKRLEMLQRAPGGDNGAMVVLLRELGDLRQQIAQIAAKAAAPPPAPAPPALNDQLSQLREGWETVRAIGGSDKLPSDETQLNIRVALDKLNFEREARQRELDFQFEERRRQLDNDRIRSEAIAEQIRQWGPIIAQGAQTWFSQQGAASGSSPAAGEGAAAGVAALAPTPRPGPAPLSVLPDRPMAPEELGQVEGPCPSCGVALRIRPSPQNDDTCPSCHMALAVVAGKIWPRLPAASGTALGSVAG